MKVRIRSSVIVPALIVTMFSSLMIIVLLTQIDQIVNGVLYDFGLRFSFRWTWPYWTYSGLVVSLSWFNILAAIGLTYYFFKGRRHLAEESVKEGFVGEEQMQLEGYEGALVEEDEDGLIPDFDESQQGGEELVEAQIGELSLQKLEIKRYDVRRPKDIVDSQC
jgi:hypothetical protein